MNTTRTILRSKEVGIRKISGSSSLNVFVQFCGEIVTICVLALVLAIGLIYLLIPYFNTLILTNLTFEELLNTYSLIAVTGSFLFISLLAGVFPSLSLAAFKPTTMLRKVHLQSSKTENFYADFYLVSNTQLP